MSRLTPLEDIVVYLVLFFASVALAGSRTDAAEAAVRDHRLEESASLNKEIEGRASARRDFFSELRVTKITIGMYVADIEDIRSAHAALVRGCTDSPMVADWNRELVLFADATKKLATRIDDLQRRSVEFRPEGYVEAAQRGSLLSSSGNDVVLRNYECKTRPAPLGDYATTLDMLRGLDQRLRAIEVSVETKN